MSGAGRSARAFLEAGDQEVEELARNCSMGVVPDGARRALRRLRRVGQATIEVAKPKPTSCGYNGAARGGCPFDPPGNARAHAGWIAGDGFAAMGHPSFPCTQVLQQGKPTYRVRKRRSVGSPRFYPRGPHAEAV